MLNTLETSLPLGKMLQVASFLNNCIPHTGFFFNGLQRDYRLSTNWGPHWSPSVLYCRDVAGFQACIVARDAGLSGGCKPELELENSEEMAV